MEVIYQISRSHGLKNRRFESNLRLLGQSQLSNPTAWWLHQMETFSALLALFAGNSPVTSEFPAQRPVARSFDVFFHLRCIKDWVNNREAGDLRRHHAHYDVIVMDLPCFKVKHYFGHISGMVGPIDVKRKGSALVGYWVQYVTLTFDLTHDLDLGCFKVKFRNSSISGIVGLIDVKWKESELI